MASIKYALLLTKLPGCISFRNLAAEDEPAGLEWLVLAGKNKDRVCYEVFWLMFTATAGYFKYVIMTCFRFTECEKGPTNKVWTEEVVKLINA